MAWPTTDNPRTEFVTLRLTADEAADLDAHASSKGLSRSAAVRDATARVIDADRRRKRKKARAASTAGADTAGADTAGADTASTE